VEPLHPGVNVSSNIPSVDLSELITYICLSIGREELMSKHHGSQLDTEHCGRALSGPP
jgi:hypothetical protein